MDLEQSSKKAYLETRAAVEAIVFNNIDQAIKEYRSLDGRPSKLLEGLELAMEGFAEICEMPIGFSYQASELGLSDEYARLRRTIFKRIKMKNR